MEHPPGSAAAAPAHLRLMEIAKTLTAGPALSAAIEHIHFPVGGGPDPDNVAFSQWWNDNVRDSRTEMTPESAEALIASCPDDPAGVAWRTRMQEIVDATRADMTRPFDAVILDDAVLGEIHDVEQTLRRTSPLLGIVADVVGGINDDFDVREILAYLDNFTPDGIYVSACLLDYDTDDDEVLVPWRHIDMLRSANGEMGHVSTRGEVRGLTLTIMTAIGEVGDEREGYIARRIATAEQVDEAQAREDADA